MVKVQNNISIICSILSSVRFMCVPVFPLVLHWRVPSIHFPFKITSSLLLFAVCDGLVVHLLVLLVLEYGHDTTGCIVVKSLLSGGLINSIIYKRLPGAGTSTPEFLQCYRPTCHHSGNKVL